ncbi:MAG TPA: cytochrome c oxidase subunit 3 [Acidimicrobiales bacterium]|jgi:heme/copper-type cytochrome/quinol oxidase subunit 3
MTVAVTEAAAPEVEHEDEHWVETGRPGEVLPARYGGPRAFGWWGMVFLIATEATLFALLIASYFYLRFRFGPPWPPDGIEDPKLALPLVMTVVLWSSSPCVHLAERGIRAGSQRRLRAGLAAGWVLGATFLVLTFAVEWPTTLKEFGPTTNAYGSMFFTITGFHAAHVVVGLLFSTWVQVWAWRGLYDRDRHLSVENFALYWQFVDAVWLFVLLTVYLSPRL